MPYAGWRQAGEPGARTLLEVFREMKNGLGAPPEFNFQLAVVAAKDTQEPDADPGRLTRNPQDTRPLALKNSDSKTIMGTAVYSVKHVTARRIRPIQRG